jgi:hypothetical protein
VGFSRILESKPGDRISCARHRDPSSGALALAHLTPTRRAGKFKVNLLVPSFQVKSGDYLNCHVDKGLGIVSTEILSNLSFVTIGEYVCNQRNPFVRSMIVNQTFPRWDAAAV